MNCGFPYPKRSGCRKKSIQISLSLSLWRGVWLFHTSQCDPTDASKRMALPVTVVKIYCGWNITLSFDKLNSLPSSLHKVRSEQWPPMWNEGTFFKCEKTHNDSKGVVVGTHLSWLGWWGWAHGDPTCIALYSNVPGLWPHAHIMYVCGNPTWIQSCPKLARELLVGRWG